MNSSSTSTGTHGRAWRSRATSSDSRVSAFSRSSSARRAASHSWRVPIFVVMAVLLLVEGLQLRQRLAPAFVHVRAGQAVLGRDPLVLEPQLGAAVLGVAERERQQRLEGGGVELEGEDDALVRDELLDHRAERVVLAVGVDHLDE